VRPSLLDLRSRLAVALLELGALGAQLSAGATGGAQASRPNQACGACVRRRMETCLPVQLAGPNGAQAGRGRQAAARLLGVRRVDALSSYAPAPTAP
jgi:hypothetical protein